jgi:hypothetical protein
MPELELDPRDTIDRKAEQELFADLVSFATSARILVISDKIDRGKSTLLRRLEYNCKRVIKPPLPACLVDLGKSDLLSPFAFIDEIVRDLKIDERFPKFIPLKNARGAKNFSPFDTSDVDMLGQVAVKSQIDTGGGSNIRGNVSVAGDFVGRDKVVHGDVVEGDKIGGDKIVVQQITRGEFTDVQEEIARKKCIEAFFDDLRVLCATQPIVMLLDHWEKCNYDLREWIRNTFMGEHCFHPDKNLRPAKLAVVVAGNIFDEAKERFGIRDKEFIDLFKDEQEHNEAVLSRASLSDWESDHIREFLKQNGYFKNVSDEDIDYLRSCLKRGMTFGRIRDISKSISSGDT